MAAGPRQQHRSSSLAPQYASAPPRNARKSFETWPETASSLGQSATARQNRRRAIRSRSNWRLPAPSANATPTSSSPADARRGIRIACARRERPVEDQGHENVEGRWMREVVGAVVPPAHVAREEGLLLLKPRQQPAGLLEVSGVGDVLKFVEGTGEPGGRDECKASPEEQQQACDQDCAVHGLW